MNFGILTKVDMLINFPLAITVAFSIALVPAIASHMSNKNVEEARKKANFSILATTLIALPATVGMIILANPILNLLFPKAPEGTLFVQVSALTILFSSIGQTSIGILNGLRKSKSTSDCNCN